MATRLQLGGPNEQGAVIGPLISQKQLTRVLGYLDEGKNDGVEIVTGGHRLPPTGYFLPPTPAPTRACTNKLFPRANFWPPAPRLPPTPDHQALPPSPLPTPP